MSKLKFPSTNGIFFTADTHFGHKNIIKYCNRPYDHLDHMMEEMIKTWNSTVGELDTVFHLGDFSFLDRDKSAWILSRLNGVIILIKGNHDSTKIVENIGFDGVYDLVELAVEEDSGVTQLITLCHYPIAVWPSSHYGAWHLHGHSHGTYKVNTGKVVDAGWDVWGKPISYDVIKTYMNSRKLSEVDHHSISEYRNNAKR